MTNRKSTKRALLGSVMAMVLCLAMLIGATFAWFTDTASTGVNKIQAGNLDIEIQDKDGKEANFLYNWDGSGEDGNDLYFNVSLNGNTYTFTVESYLCDNTTDVYAAVKNLQVGDKIDMEGFLYWYNGVNPHITSVTAAQ